MKPKIIAHRGYSAKAPENTLSSVKAALALGVDFIEIDVRLTKDNVPIILHDPALSRTTWAHKKARIHHYTLEQIKELDAGSWFSHEFVNETIPTLQELLSLDWGNTGLMIEVKQCAQPHDLVIDRVLHGLEMNKSSLPRLVIGSFSLSIVKLMQHLLPSTSQIELLGIVERPERLRSFVKTGIKRLAIWCKIITPHMMNWLHENDIEVWSFTVDQPDIAHFLTSLNVEGIISNDPKTIMNSFDNK